MKRLFTIDKNDYDESWQHSKRPSIRAVIFKGDKLAMVYSVRDDYYKFPGGGMEEHEDHHSTLIREVREEVGLNVIPSSVKEFGEVVILGKSDIFENTVFEQENFYYFCEVEENITEQSLDEYEAESGFELRYVTPEEAYELDSRYPDVDFLVREAGVLKMLAEQTYNISTGGRIVKLVDITKENYVQVALLTTNEDLIPTVLEKYVTSNAFSMAQSKYSDKWITKAVEHDGNIIGFVMYGPTDLDGATVFQLCRFMIDVRFQGKGYGKQALSLVLDEMKRLDGCKEVYLSIEPENKRARHIYENAGFVCLDREISGELLFKLKF